MKLLKKIGCDPELFLFDNVLNRVVPACGIVEGSKESPIVLNNGGMVQLDGTVLEFGTPPVTPWGKNFSKALKDTLDIIRKQLSDNYGDRYELRCGAIASYSPEDIAENHEGLLVGCSPQYVIIPTRDLPIRGVLESQGVLARDAVPIGGHIHFGFVDNMRDEVVQNYSALRYQQRMENYGLECIIGDVPCDATSKRKDVMGFPQHLPTIRIKPYGVEFRNLSSYWLACPKLADLFSKFHNLVTTKCVNPNATVTFNAPLTEIRVRMEALSSRIASQDAKYQQTLPLAY